MIEALKHAEMMCPFNGQVLMEKIRNFVNLYEYWIETTVRDPRFIEQNWSYCYLYYKEIYREIKHKVNDQIIGEVYNNVMRNAYVGNKLNGVVPKMTLQEFMNKMEEIYQKELLKEEKKKKG